MENTLLKNSDLSHQMERLRQFKEVLQAQDFFDQLRLDPKAAEDELKQSLPGIWEIIFTQTRLDETGEREPRFKVLHSMIRELARENAVYARRHGISEWEILADVHTNWWKCRRDSYGGQVRRVVNRLEVALLSQVDCEHSTGVADQSAINLTNKPKISGTPLEHLSKPMTKAEIAKYLNDGVQVSNPSNFLARHQDEIRLQGSGRTWRADVRAFPERFREKMLGR